MRTFHGISKMRSSHVRIQACSGDCWLVRSSRSISLATALDAFSGSCGLGQLGAVLLDDVVVALAELLADRGELLAQQVLALLLVHALGDVGADLRGDLQLGQVVLGPLGGQRRPVLELDGAQDGQPGGPARPRSTR